MDSDRAKQTMLANAAILRELQSRIHLTVKSRAETPEKRAKWERACAELHSRYEQLAFPGGYSGALDRITSGDSETIETALCFLECRPYFFRSGYMFKDILRKCKRAPMSPEQASRLDEIVQRLAEWRQQKESEQRLK